MYLRNLRKFVVLEIPTTSKERRHLLLWFTVLILNSKRGATDHPQQIKGQTGTREYKYHPLRTSTT